MTTPLTLKNFTVAEKLVGEGANILNPYIWARMKP
jgi:hypothetical protein